jgi:hypothetical protein
MTSELVREAIELARVAADELESLLRGDEGRLLDPDEQRRLGAALGRIEAAECILAGAAGDEDHLGVVSGEAFALACAAVHELARQGSATRARESLNVLLAAGADDASAEEARARELALARLGQSE